MLSCITLCLPYLQLPVDLKINVTAGNQSTPWYEMYHIQNTNIFLLATHGSVSVSENPCVCTFWVRFLVLHFFPFIQVERTTYCTAALLRVLSFSIDTYWQPYISLAPYPQPFPLLLSAAIILGSLSATISIAPYQQPYPLLLINRHFHCSLSAAISLAPHQQASPLLLISSHIPCSSSTGISIAPYQQPFFFTCRPPLPFSHPS